jgi:hypothetical protein
MDPVRMTRILVPRPVVMISPKAHTPIALWRIPRTALEIMCVIGEVILMDNTPAMERSHPTMPVTSEPQRKRPSTLSSPLPEYKGDVARSIIPLPSPTSHIIGMRAMEERTLEYQASSMALPLTSVKECFITMAWDAVVNEEISPNAIPSIEVVEEGLDPSVVAESGERSRKTPTKKPTETTAHARSTRMEGRDALRKTRERRTVRGRMRPLATW